MRLRTKLAVALVVVAIVLSAGVYGGLELYKDRLVGQAQGEVNETATLTADQIDTSVEQHKDFIGFAASRPEASRFNESDEYLRDLVDNTRFFAAQIIDANGTVVDFNGDITQDIRQETIGSDVGDRAYVREALDGEVYMTEPEFAPGPGEHLAIVSAPIFEGRRIKGVLAASIYVDRQTFFTTLGPLETSTQAVSVREGQTTLFEQHRSFDQEIMARATVASTGWTVTIVRDSSSLTGQLRDLAAAQALGIFIVMLAVVSFGVWEYRTTLNQTERLLAGFAALRRGEFGYRIRLTAGEEWEQISDGFNELADSLSDRDIELRR
ncbi:MAG: cache domain-containing protein, partial [Halobacteriales archaeon]|nr:cache domain-containing protein [Halobacteriales archaeon]